jgi:hypothetical protein
VCYTATRHALQLHLVPSGNDFTFYTSSQIYCVYVNSVSAALRDSLNSQLKAYSPYIGYADMTYGSPFKTYLSRTLGSGYVKHASLVIQGHPDDVPPEENENTLGHQFEKFGIACRGVPESYEGLLLTYKIESPVLPGDESDTLYSINAIADSP